MTSKSLPSQEFPDSPQTLTADSGGQMQLEIPFTDWMEVHLELPESRSPVHISGPLLTVLLSLTRFVIPCVLGEDPVALRSLRKKLQVVEKRVQRTGK